MRIMVLLIDVAQRLAVRAGDAGDLEAAVELAALGQEAGRLVVQAGLAARRRRRAPCLARRVARDVAVVRVGAEHVLVQLHPQVVQRVRRVVVVGDGLAAADGALRFVQRGADLVVGALLPVGVARGAGGGAGVGGRGQQFVELAELVVEWLGEGGAGEAIRVRAARRRAGVSWCLR
jgi:hypothetical protein